MNAMLSAGAFWADARAQMLYEPTVVNLNTGSFGPLPRCVFEHATELRRRLAAEPMDFLVRQMPPLLWHARRRLADFLGCDSRRLIFTANVSVAINLVAASLRLMAPGEILLTDHEYGAMHWCWERAAQRQGLTLRTFPLPTMAETPAEIVAEFDRAITDRTRLLFFSHVLSPTGLVLPAREICALAHKRGVVCVVDGAHAPAMIPLQLRELACEFYAGNCHKWMLAPTGTGFLYCASADKMNLLQPMQVSWGWRHDRAHLDEPDEFGTTPRIRHLEFEGTRDYCPWMSVPVALEFQENLGWQRIRERNLALAAYARERLERFPLASPAHPELHGFLTAFQLPENTNAQALRDGLWKRFRIEAPVVERPERLLLRVSTHFYNTEEEIDRLADAMAALVPAGSV
jgi:isopenicillin-N epimerase